jgi:hypothetical protein
MKKVANAHTVHIGVAIGQRHQRVALVPKRQSWQGIGIQIDLLALGEKNLERRFGQVLGVACLLQQGPNGFKPQERQIMGLVGVARVDFLAQGFFQVGLFRKYRSGGGMFGQPLVQGRFGAVNGGPDVSSRSRVMARIREISIMVRENTRHGIPQRTFLSAWSGSTHGYFVLQLGHPQCANSPCLAPVPRRIFG